MKILTWHVHGNYLLYLTRYSPHDFFLPVAPDGSGGRGTTFPFGDNVHEVPVEEVKDRQFDCVLYQHRDNWFHDRDSVLSPSQKRLPQIYLEHDPPLEHPTEERHPAAGAPNVLIVHCTAFNALMWDNGDSETRVIEHGVFLMNDASANYERPRGVAAVNNIGSRGRRAGGGLLSFARRNGVAVDLVGMQAEAAGGLGEVSPPKLPAFLSSYRYYFNPSLYTSLNLAMIEAMMVGLPVVALRTTEAATVIENGENGFADTDANRLLEPMRELAADPALARKLGEKAAARARERFSIRRFTNEWNAAFDYAAGRSAG